MWRTPYSLTLRYCPLSSLRRTSATWPSLPMALGWRSASRIAANGWSHSRRHWRFRSPMASGWSLSHKYLRVRGVHLRRRVKIRGLHMRISCETKRKHGSTVANSQRKRSIINTITVVSVALFQTKQLQQIKVTVTLALAFLRYQRSRKVQ